MGVGVANEDVCGTAIGDERDGGGAIVDGEDMVVVVMRSGGRASVGCATHHFRGVAPHQTNQPDWWVSNLFSRSMFEDEVICVFVLLFVFISCLGLRRCSFVLLFALSKFSLV